MQIHGDEFQRGRILHRIARAIARFQSAPQTIAMAGIDRDRALRAQISCADRLDNFLFQSAQPVFCQAGNPQRVVILPIGMFRQIALVQEHDRLVGPSRVQQSPAVSARCDRRCAGADRRSEEISPCGRSLRARDRPAESRRPAVSSRRIGTPRRLITSSIVSRVVPGMVADDRAIETEQAIEQTGFAGIGRAINHHAYAFAQNASLFRGGEEVGDLFANRIESCAQVCRPRPARCLPRENRSMLRCARSAR